MCSDIIHPDLPARRRRGESGQTLLLGAIALVILLLAILFLFDLQSVIRIKMKAQTAVDAAALAGATWQKHSLNLIGEMNLIKACTVLISDIPSEHSVPVDFLKNETDLETVQAASDLLSEMQARVSFVGPLIGFGAAQQAAKNNGLNYNPEYGVVVNEHLQRVLNDNIYGDEAVVPQTIEGYSWRDPYASLIAQIADYDYGDNSTPKGIAVSCTTRFLGAPILTSDPPTFIGYLQSKYIYDAINGNYWCAIRDLIRMDFGATGNKWWGDIELLSNSTSFPQEAEYLTLGIDFFEGAHPYNVAESTEALQSVIDSNEAREDLQPLRNSYDAYDPGDPSDTDLKFDPLPSITWATFGSQWGEYSSDTVDTWGNTYLYSNFKQGYTYYGAVSKMITEVKLDSLSGNWGQIDGSDKYMGDAMAFGGSNSGGAYVNSSAAKLKSAEGQMKSGLQNVDASALAKPYGRIHTESSGYITPQTAGMVLPVFEKAAIIPVSLEDPGGFDPFDYQWYAFLTEYLPHLGTVSSLAEQEAWMTSQAHSSWYSSYHAALKKLDNPEWRAQGIAWLDAEARGHDVYDANGNVVGHIVDATNEDTCDDWGSGPGPGTRQGPNMVH